MDWFDTSDYWLGRLLFKEGLAVIYLCAFLVAANQFRPLLGDHGMLPIRRFLAGRRWQGSPSIFHLHYSDRFFAFIAWTGAGLAALALLGLLDLLPLPLSMLGWLLLWALYLSIVNVGQLWYGFGWESLLLEVGLLAVFVGNAHTAPPLLTLLLLRWVLFRLEFGAGLIKIRGDPCWRDLTCLYYHHETQPMPGPLSWLFHRLPRPLHKVEVAGNHFTQLIVPFFLFMPQPVAGGAAAIMIATQLWLVASGNFSWLNWLAIVLGLSVLPDGFWEALLPISAPTGIASSPTWFVVAVVAFTAAIVALSYRPARNLLSSHQMMNASFDPWHLVNTYGAFGHITRTRREIVVEGTTDEHVTPDTEWRAYEFKGKPGDLRRRPRQFAPYHLRLDWLMWFAAISPSYAAPWFGGFVTRLLDGDRATLKLLHHNPFPDRPPTYVRARTFRYRFTTRAERRATGAWWARTYESDFMPPASLQRRQ
ncbi:lipase maturation factor family protein [Rhodococcus xishaensis]|uniref:Lipase maturation factor family protein n=1 Tax=Rhodococcus xishaensis TaxID=2487364 RepID=A0A3S3ABM0_9NOCA|nr:lipase maturation factor family protein [Rhodococcus xishaensis]RVW04199.1 lipase maturation factor family protein [Rhodococcus xishaensis]